MPILKRRIIDDFLLNEIPEGQNERELNHKAGTALHLPRVIPSKKLGTFHHICSDPVFLYLKFCELSLEQIEKLRSNLSSQSLIRPPSGKKFTEKVYSEEKIELLSQHSMSFVVMLFSGLEAFLNEHIPEDFTYSVIKRHRVKFWGMSFSKRKKVDLKRGEIQREIGTKEKLTKVYKKIFNKDITKSDLYQSFLALKQLRDEINHLKSVRPTPKFIPPKGTIPSFNEKGELKVTCRLSPKEISELTRDENAWIMTNLVDLDVISSLAVVIKIMNFFVDDYVQFSEEIEAL